MQPRRQELRACSESPRSPRKRASCSELEGGKQSTSRPPSFLCCFSPPILPRFPSPSKGVKVIRDQKLNLEALGEDGLQPTITEARQTGMGFSPDQHLPCWASVQLRRMVSPFLALPWTSFICYFLPQFTTKIRWRQSRQMKESFLAVCELKLQVWDRSKRVNPKELVQHRWDHTQATVCDSVTVHSAQGLWPRPPPSQVPGSTQNTGAKWQLMQCDSEVRPLEEQFFLEGMLIFKSYYITDILYLKSKGNKFEQLQNIGHFLLARNCWVLSMGILFNPNHHPAILQRLREDIPEFRFHDSHIKAGAQTLVWLQSCALCFRRPKRSLLSQMQEEIKTTHGESM